MRKLYTFIIALVVAIGMQAQTLNVVVGEVTYQVPATQASDMVYTNGTTLTILNKTFNVSDISSMYIDNTSVTDNTISVVYNGTTAAVKVAGNCMQYVDVVANGAAVSIVQSASLANELTYTLSGTSSNGSFYMDGTLKATVVLSDLSLTCTDSAAVNIENGKRINLTITGTNTLKDSASSGGKGALMVNGHPEISGAGTLNLYGYKKHAMWADEYVQLKKSFTGTINVLYAVGDGLNVTQYFEQNGGTLNIQGTLDDGIQVSADDEASGYVNIQGGTLTINTTAAANKSLKADGSITIGAGKSTPTVTITNSGTGKWDTDDSEVKGAACLSSDANITIDAGVITLTATGNGGKGLKCDSVFTLNGGNVTVTTSGKLYVSNGTATYDGTYSNQLGSIDNLADAYSSSPKGVRVGISASQSATGSAVGDIQINDGTLSITCSGAQDGSEGLESKNTMSINGGTVNVTAYDDAINTAKDLYITGGTITAVSQNNDAVDSNANMYITGGVIGAFGAAAPECGLDVDRGYGLYFNGGTILNIGGASTTPSTLSTSAYVSTSGTITAGSTITLKSGTTTLASYTVPTGYASKSTGGSGGGRPGGGSSSGYSIVMSHANLSSGTSYTVTNGSTTSTVTARK